MLTLTNRITMYDETAKIDDATLTKLVESIYNAEHCNDARDTRELKMLLMREAGASRTGIANHFGVHLSAIATGLQRARKLRAGRQAC